MKKFKIVYLFILSLLLIGCTGNDNIEIFKFVNLEYVIHVGESTNLQLTMGQYPEDSNVIYTFSEDNIISFEDGTVTGLKVGEVDITATVDKLIYATTKVIVIGKEIDGLQIIAEKNTIYVDEELQLSVRIFPEEFSDEVTWSLEKLGGVVSDVAEITPDGLLKPLRGEKTQAEITAGGARVRVVATSVVDGKVQAKRDFYVRYRETATLTLTAKDDKVDYLFSEIDENTTILLETGQTPANSYPLNYTSSDTSILLIDATGLLTFPEVLKAGSVTITVKSLDNKTATITINIIDDTDEVIDGEE